MATATIVLVEDDALLASLLANWIGRRADWRLAGHAANAQTGIMLCRETRPDLLLLDVAMPGMDGLTMVEQLREEMPDLKVLVLSCHADPYTIQRVQRLGLQGYISKTSSLEHLAVAITDILAGGTHYDDTFRQSAAPLSDPEAFHKIVSRREIEILALVSEGLSDTQIGTMLGISAHTVAAHRRNIRVKLRAHNDRDLLFYARQWGLARSIMAPAGADPRRP